jgi:hypothetical protein
LFWQQVRKRRRRIAQAEREDGPVDAWSCLALDVRAERWRIISVIEGPRWW